MIVTEYIVLNHEDFTHTYSDAGRYVVRDNKSYIEAYNPTRLGYTYTEGELIPPYDPTKELRAKAEGYEILVGDRT